MLYFSYLLFLCISSLNYCLSDISIPFESALQTNIKKFSASLELNVLHFLMYGDLTIS